MRIDQSALMRSLYPLPAWLIRQLSSIVRRSSKSIVRLAIAGCLVLCIWANQPLNHTQYSRANLAPASAFAAEPPPRILNASPEIRGVWITNVASSILFSPWGIPRAFNQLADLRFNTVYPVVWNRGKAFYHSDALERITGQAIAPLLNLMHLGQDPLREMVQLSHQKNMRILPWFEYGFMVPLDSKLARQHPEWLTSRQNGSQFSAKEASPTLADEVFKPEAEAVSKTAIETDAAPSPKVPEKAPSKIPSKKLIAELLDSGAPNRIAWLNPMHPSVQGLLLEMVEEVIAQYEVDGIQFDDHFSLPVEFGYDPYTVALYQAEHSGQAPPSNPADADWIRWRAEKLSKFVEILHIRVKAICPTCQLSLSPNPAKFAYRFYLQDWQTWVREGWIDDLVVQLYRDDMAQFDSELDKQALREASDRIPVSIGILTGTWQKPIAFEQIKQQVEHSRNRQFAGVSFFYWDTLWSYFTPESPQQRRQNFRALLEQPLTRKISAKESASTDSTGKSLYANRGAS